MSDLSKGLASLSEAGGRSSAGANEGNLLTLITLDQLLTKAPGAAGTAEAIGLMAKEETRHLVQAMKILTDTRSGEEGAAAQKLQDKFGRDMAGAVALSSVLQSEGAKKEVELLINPFVMDTIRSKGSGRQQRGGFTTGKSTDKTLHRSADYATGNTGWGQTPGASGVPNDLG